MENQIISLETAKLAKEKGFWLGNESSRESMTFYRSDGIFVQSMLPNDCFEDEFYAPTQSFLQKWLREEHKIYLLVEIDQILDTVFYKYRIFQSGIILSSITAGGSKMEYKTYEDALEAGLEKALKFIK